MKLTRSRRLTRTQLEYIQKRLCVSWITVLNTQAHAKFYVPPQVWEDSALDTYFNDEKTRITECVDLISDKLGKFCCGRNR